MTTEIRFLIDCLIEELALKLSKDNHIPIIDAMNKIYNSQWYDKIMDLETGLYYQSADYNYINLSQE